MYKWEAVSTSEADFDDLTNKPEESGTIDMSEIVTPLPTPETHNYPIGFDESGAEYQVEWYKRASDGKVKPIYRKTVDCGAMPNNAIKSVSLNISNIEKVVSFIGLAGDSNGTYSQLGYASFDNYGIEIKVVTNDHFEIYAKQNKSAMSGYVTLRYTKTIDEWREI